MTGQEWQKRGRETEKKKEKHKKYLKRINWISLSNATFKQLTLGR